MLFAFGVTSKLQLAQPFYHSQYSVCVISQYLIHDLVAIAITKILL